MSVARLGEAPKRSRAAFLVVERSWRGLESLGKVSRGLDRPWRLFGVLERPSGGGARGVFGGAFWRSLCRILGRFLVLDEALAGRGRALAESLAGFAAFSGAVGVFGGAFWRWQGLWRRFLAPSESVVALSGAGGVFGLFVVALSGALTKSSWRSLWWRFLALVKSWRLPEAWRGRGVVWLRLGVAGGLFGVVLERPWHGSCGEP